MEVAEFAFRRAFSDWVEALWFGETDEANRSLGILVDLPPEVVLGEALGVLRGLQEAHIAQSLEPALAGALADHLIVEGDDPERVALIAEVVAMAGREATPAGRAAVLARRGGAAVTGAALECASMLTQVVAERVGVVPSVILEDL